MGKVCHKSIKNQRLFECLLNVRDPRVKGRCSYPLLNVLVMVLCGMIAGANTWEGIADFAKKRSRWLNQFIDMACGVPSPVTFARIFSLIKPEEFQACLINWMSDFFELIEHDMIHIDGKTLRGSARKAHRQKGSHIVNAYFPKEQLTLAECRVPDKTNEIKAIPMLLNKLEVKGCILTIDAMGTQKGIAKLIREKQSHYVLALKENHRRFHRKIHRLFEESEALDFNAMMISQCDTKSIGHGRIEERHYSILPMMYCFPYKKYWRDLASVVRVQSKRIIGEKVETSTRYYISSLPFKEHNRICQAIRQHWSVENNLHWKLDVGLAEDACQVTRGYADQNLATMRKIVLKLLEDETSSRHGIAIKRLQAALSTRYLRKVVGF